MDTLEAISRRRSIRKFKPVPISDENLNLLLSAAALAPSGKNRQPWKMIVVRGEKLAEMIRVMREGIDKTKARGDEIGSAEWSAKCMEQAPVTVFFINPGGLPPWKEHSIDQTFWDVVDIQSAGAAIENMLLAATDMGIGSLWICDVFSAYEELMDWLGETGELIAAVALGYPAESPEARPRKPIGDVVRFL
jgi:nitroreductase